MVRARLPLEKLASYGRAIPASTISVTFLGHASAVLEMGGARLVTDPLLRDRIGYLRRVGAQPRADLLAGVDAVLISHVHHDHLDGPSLRRLGTGTPVVAPAGALKLLRAKGMRQVIELLPGERTEIAGVPVEATHAEHRASRLPGTGPIPAVGYVVGDGPRIFFAGDTDLFLGMEAIGDLGLDVTLLPITGWGPRTPPGHLDPTRAAEALRLLRPRIVVPIHWGTLAPVWWRRPTAATLRAPADDFLERARTIAPDVEVRVLPPGESFVTRAVTHH